MKKISKLKLNQLSKNDMEKREMNNLRGREGPCCGCGCHYSGSGGSSAYDNLNENYINGQHSPGGDIGCITEPGPATLPTC